MPTRCRLVAGSSQRHAALTKYASHRYTALIGIHLSQAYNSHRVYISEIYSSYRHASLTVYVSHRCAALTSVQLSYGIHLIGVHIRQACSPCNASTSGLWEILPIPNRNPTIVGFLASGKSPSFWKTRL